MTCPTSILSARLPSIAAGLALCVAATTVVTVQARAHAYEYQYVSPLPGSQRVATLNNVVLRPGDALDRSSLAAARLTVNGGASGVHTGRLVLSDDTRTLVFVPDRAFAPGEDVTVAMRGGIRTRAGANVPAIRYTFTTAADEAPARAPGIRDELEGGETRPAPAAAPAPLASRAAATRTMAIGDPLPSKMPPVTLLRADHPEPGAVFFAPFTQALSHTMIFDNAGYPLYYHRYPYQVLDFKMHADGMLTYYGAGNTFWGLDSTYAVVDSFRTGNGYQTDGHELLRLPNGHAILMAYDTQVVHMDSIVPGGKPNANVEGLIVQEIDAAKNVVFQWRSWDHFAITDADTCLVNLRAQLVDYAHANAMALANDGNILVSSRHMNEITKIDRATGDILWRFGPHAKHNDFTVLGDPRGFTAQHDIRCLPNGHLTMFDNGDCVAPQMSRGVEYELDETNMTATLVWECRPTPSVYSSFMGDVQRFANGGNMIGWGGIGADPKLTEIHADGTVAYALGFANTSLFTYRAFRFPWHTTRFEVDPGDIDLATPVEVGHPVTLPLSIRNRFTAPITITGIFAHDAKLSVSPPAPLSILPGATADVGLMLSPTAPGEFLDTLYVRTVTDTEFVAQPVVVRWKAQASGFWVEDAICYEGPAGTKVLPFLLHIPQPQTGDVSVQYTTLDGTATAADSDYIPAAGIATIQAGDTTTTIDVLIPGDAQVEPYYKSFVLEISNPDALLINRFDAAGTVVDDDLLTGVDAGVPVAFADDAEPNPARGDVSIRYALPRAARVSIDVFDLSGRRVHSVVDAFRPAGRYRATWAAGPAASGVYFYRIQAGTFHATRKLVIVR